VLQISDQDFIVQLESDVASAIVGFADGYGELASGIEIGVETASQKSWASTKSR
jgi:hypothetical protein